MDPQTEFTDEDVDRYYQRLKQDAEQSAYHLNPDEEMTLDLVRGLMVNEGRLGYPACPCRLPAGEFEADLDIICPCDYRDPDLDEYGMCYCALYVTNEVLGGAKAVAPIPERRPPIEGRLKTAAAPGAAEDTHGAGTRPAGLTKPVWRCRVCGYLCGRDQPPENCPICKAAKERFERFM